MNHPLRKAETLFKLFFFSILLSMTYKNLYAYPDVMFNPPDPYFTYTGCYPAVSSQSTTKNYRHHTSHNKSSYKIDVYYTIPHSSCASCIKWVPASCTCYGECIPGHWEAYTIQSSCRSSHFKSYIDTKAEHSSEVINTHTSDDDFDFDTRTLDDTDNDILH